VVSQSHRVHHRRRDRLRRRRRGRYGIRPLTRLRDDAYLAAFAVWMASGLELALTSDVATPTRFRSSLVYLALAVLALSSYLRTWTARQYPEAP
jgi:hypothetical protein